MPDRISLQSKLLDAANAQLDRADGAPRLLPPVPSLIRGQAVVPSKLRRFFPWRHGYGRDALLGEDDRGVAGA
jgi:hypothetical protein